MTKASNLTNQVQSPHLRPHTTDLNRLLTGDHHDPHSVLGAHSTATTRSSAPIARTPWRSTR